MSLYEDDKEEINEMIDDKIKEIPDIGLTQTEQTKRLLIEAVAGVLVGLMLFGTICFGINSSKENKKYEYQYRTYGELNNKEE